MHSSYADGMSVVGDQVRGAGGFSGRCLGPSGTNQHILRANTHAKCGVIRDPSYFWALSASNADTICYLQRYADLQAAYCPTVPSCSGTQLDNARYHYVQMGIGEGRTFNCEPANSMKSCQANAACAALGLGGNCCPTDDGTTLSCCDDQGSSSSGGRRLFQQRPTSAAASSRMTPQAQVGRWWRNWRRRRARLPIATSLKYALHTL